MASNVKQTNTDQISTEHSERQPELPPQHAPGSPVVAVIGDGQLARMMQTAAIELGQTVRLLAADHSASAAQVCADVTIGDYKNEADVQKVAAGADAVTFDHEHVPNEFLQRLQSQNISVQPGPQALIYAQDKLLMRQKLAEIGAPVPPFAQIESVEDAQQFADQVDGQVCLKARRGGYDGHGVWFPVADDSTAEGSAPGRTELVQDLLDQGVPLMAEKKVALRRELSAMCARTPSGQVQPWPVLQSVQKDGICVEAIAPAPDMSDELRQEAEELSVRIAESLGVTGVLAVELFEVLDDAGQPQIFVNELAMRPHNTGHWTQDGCVTDQFEQHLRAVLDYPLGATQTVAPVTVMRNTLGGEVDPELPLAQRFAAVWQRFPEVKIHWYGKGWRPGRKMGHVNICGDDASEAGVARLREIAELAAGYIVDGVWHDQSEGNN